MAHLSDMEELVGSIENAQIRDYMSESLSCYMAGAYRASVVLTFIALFEDIFSKLEQLGKVNAKAKSIFDDAKQRRSEQQVFETFLIDQLKAKALFSALDAEFLEILRDLRNKAAHPSGHHSSAEEARFVFHESISRFLSKPILSTTQLVDELLASISNSNFFPAKQINVIVQVVKKELENLHPEAYPYLISKLLDKIQSTDKAVSKNARFFLSGFSASADDAVLSAIRKYCIVKLSANKTYQNTIITLLSSNGKLFQGLDDITYKRIEVLVSDRVSEIDLTLEHTTFSHPASLFLSLFKSNDGNFVIDKLGKQLDEFLDKFLYSSYFSANGLGYPVAKKAFLKKIYENAGSDQFAIANEFVRNAADLDKVISGELSDEEAFRILVRVVRASNIGAYNAIDIRNAHFGALPNLRARANNFIGANAHLANQIAQEVLVDQDDVGDQIAYLQPA